MSVVLTMMAKSHCSTTIQWSRYVDWTGRQAQSEAAAVLNSVKLPPLSHVLVLRVTVMLECPHFDSATLSPWQTTQPSIPISPRQSHLGKALRTPKRPGLVMLTALTIAPASGQNAVPMRSYLSRCPVADALQRAEVTMSSAALLHPVSQ